MLSKRLTETREVMSMSDPVFLDVDIDLARRYGMTRDFKLIENIAKTATVFHVKPLMPKYEHLVEQVMSGAMQASWNIFRTHVTRVDRFDGIEFNEAHDKIEDKCRDLITLDVISEIAGVIIRLANQESQGFSLPAFWLENRTRCLALRALDVTESAGQKSE